MAWRPNRELIEGEIANTEPGKVVGWLRFIGLDELVELDLAGNFHRDIRGTVIRLKRDVSDAAHPPRNWYWEGFARLQTGEAGDITAGRKPNDYVDYPYIEWYSIENGRVVLELEHDEIEIVGTPKDWTAEQPIDRENQTRLMRGFLAGVSSFVATKRN